MPTGLSSFPSCTWERLLLFAKFHFALIFPLELLRPAAKLRGQVRSQVQLGNEERRQTALILRQAQDDKLFSQGGLGYCVSVFPGRFVAKAILVSFAARQTSSTSTTCSMSAGPRS